MFGILKKIFDFAGSRRGLLIKSMLVAFAGAVFSAAQFVALMLTLDMVVSAELGNLWIVLTIMLISVAGKILCSYCATNMETET